MKLSEVLAHIPDAGVTGRQDRNCSMLTYDSRQVQQDTLFVAVRGLWVDGHDYIDAAIEAGATGIIAETEPPSDLGSRATWIQVHDSEVVLGLASDAFYRHPSSGLHVLATTGTNGKTTISWLLYGILRANGHEPGLVGTVEQRFGTVRRDTLFTTPPSADLHALLGEMRDYGCSHVAIEASSHGLAMNRLSGLNVQVAGFSNLSRDHLDYHETMDAYREAKWLLFRDFARKACFNIDDPVGREFHRRFTGESLTVSVNGEQADIQVQHLDSSLAGCQLQLCIGNEKYDVLLPLVGAFNVQNACVAAGMAILAGIPQEDVVASLATLQPAPGRLEVVPGKRHVLVDYAHTPDALENVLRSLKALEPRRILCVFGAGGDRDPGKRPEMGSVVGRYADVAIVTSDNPRTEDPEKILDAIMKGVSGDLMVRREVDRAKAIHWAVSMADEGDVVLIAGKGHETYQIIGTERRDFDDRLQAASALASCYG